MVLKTRDGRKVEVSVYGRYGDDIQIDEAYYLDTEEDVSDEVVEQLMEDCFDAIYDLWVENKICEAEAYADSREDR